jgi:DNA-binding GntR family transcriptional regulator
MPASTNSKAQPSLLLKQSLAAQLKREIIRGTLPQGQRIVEKFWARKFEAAQTSVREAINLLISEGFATKNSGRSARVTSYSIRDIGHIYEVRAALEGLAARLLAQAKADLGSLHQAVAAMTSAIQRKNITELLEADLHFHLRLCELTGNGFLAQQARTLLVPLFAFVSMRTGADPSTTAAWAEDVDRHLAIVRAIEDGDPMLAELSVRNAIQRFAARASEIWQ